LRTTNGRRDDALRRTRRDRYRSRAGVATAALVRAVADGSVKRDGRVLLNVTGGGRAAACARRVRPGRHWYWVAPKPPPSGTMPCARCCFHSDCNEESDRGSRNSVTSPALAGQVRLDPATQRTAVYGGAPPYVIGVMEQFEAAPAEGISRGDARTAMSPVLYRRLRDCVRIRSRRNKPSSKHRTRHPQPNRLPSDRARKMCRPQTWVWSNGLRRFEDAWATTASPVRIKPTVLSRGTTTA